MFFKALLAFLLVSAVVAAPAPAVGDAAAPPIIKLKSNISCTSVASSPNPGPSQSIILLNSPSALPPVASGNYDNYAAPVQPSVGPSIIKLNDAPAGSPPVIKLNRRQFGSTSPTNTFSFGGIVPTSTPTPSPPTLSTPPTTTTSSSVSFGSTTTPPSPTNPAVQGGVSAFTTKGADGIETVFILSTVTVNAPCSSPPAVPSSGPAPSFPPAQFSATPTSVLPSNLPSPFSPAVSSPSPSLVGVNSQGPASVGPSTVATSSPSIIDLNTPFVTPTATSTGSSFSSVSTPNSTPTPFPVNAAAPANCDFACLLTATV